MPTPPKPTTTRGPRRPALTDKRIGDLVALADSVRLFVVAQPKCSREHRAMVFIDSLKAWKVKP
jgi:hypothetical protein